MYSSGAYIRKFHFQRKEKKIREESHYFMEEYADL